MKKLIYIPAVILFAFVVVDSILAFNAIINDELGDSAFWLMATFSSGVIGAILWAIASSDDEL